jgi:hypothetical protein
MGEVKRTLGASDEGDGGVSPACCACGKDEGRMKTMRTMLLLLLLPLLLLLLMMMMPMMLIMM